MSDRVTQADVVQSWEKAAAVDAAGLITNQYAKTGRDFYASGVIETGKLVYLARTVAGDWSFLDGTVLDYGGGTGRHAFWLAHLFRRTICADASPTMLEQAAAVLRDAPQMSVCRLTAGDAIPADDAELAVFFSTICLQHNTRDTVRAILADAARALRPGGLAVLQLPVVSDPQQVRYVTTAHAAAAGNTAVWHAAEFRAAIGPHFEVLCLAVDDHFGYHVLRRAR